MLTYTLKDILTILHPQSKLFHRGSLSWKCGWPKIATCCWNDQKTNWLVIWWLDLDRIDQIVKIISNKVMHTNIMWGPQMISWCLCAQSDCQQWGTCQWIMSRVYLWIVAGSGGGGFRSWNLKMSLFSLWASPTFNSPLPPNWSQLTLTIHYSVRDRKWVRIVMSIIRRWFAPSFGV